MIEIRIIKDTGAYDPKFLGPFTMRQCICLAVAAPIGAWIYTKLSPYLSKDIAGFLLAFPAALAWLFGWCRPYGMRMEQFLPSIFRNLILSSSHRPSKTENQIEKAMRLSQIIASSEKSEGNPTTRCKKYTPSKEAVQ